MKDFEPGKWAVTPELTFSNSYVLFNSVVGTQSVDIYTNYDTFSASVADDWCHVNVDEDAMKLIIEVDPNDSVEQRVTTISVNVSKGEKTLTKDISVIQFGGIWDIVGNFNVFWRMEVSQDQKDVIKRMIDSLQFIKGGTFVMGSGEDAHEVTLSSFYIGNSEVTQEQWNAIMDYNPSIFRGEVLPVENISWAEAFEYVNYLSTLTNLEFSLPTEAQWEFAARGGIYSLGYEYPGSDNYMDVAYSIGQDVLENNPMYTTIRAGEKKWNELYLYDMAGNVAEYCFDWYDDNYKNVPTDIDPIGVPSGTAKVVRGGNFTDLYFLYNSKYRSYVPSINYKKELTGFRIVLRP
ncbi:MAG: SUMF1/EgtB/PvdO family nonheme iron enzyme [Bacteroidales bacterium]|nr:SUMF1/EgtB/PvdO family nonheme iron enzyme [Clostridium sp.]MCM1503092.1 SUMF1/EgtB/PvdO family nonheme iron enzyme [Bacteroidales bacterium]